MRGNSLLLIGLVCAGLAGCGGGDVEHGYWAAAHVSVACRRCPAGVATRKA